MAWFTRRPEDELRDWERQRQSFVGFVENTDAQAWLAAHVKREAPRMAAGALLHDASSGEFKTVVALPNSSPSPSNRFQIAPSDYRRAEEIGAAMGAEIRGYFYSQGHKWPPRVSQYTLDHMWPTFLTLIVSFNDTGDMTEFAAWAMVDDRSSVREIVSGKFTPSNNASTFASEARIISSCVQIANKELMNWLAKHPDDLLRVHPGTFEQIVAELFRDQGFDVEVLGSWNQSDGGIDIIAIRKDTVAGDFRVGIQCKRYVHTRKVRADLVWALEGRLERFRLHKGVLATTAQFEQSVLADLATHLWRIELRDFERLKSDLENWGKFEVGDSGLWLPR